VSLRRRIDRLEQRTPDPDARGPRHLVLWDPDEPVPDDLPPGSTVTRVQWGPDPATNTPQPGETK
jgi:hypothetical protein